jgi:hypothetical protein
MVKYVINKLDYNMAFSISALVSSLRLPYRPKAIAEGLYGSRDDTRANMENVML